STGWRSAGGIATRATANSRPPAAVPLASDTAAHPFSAARWRRTVVRRCWCQGRGAPGSPDLAGRGEQLAVGAGGYRGRCGGGELPGVGPAEDGAGALAPQDAGQRAGRGRGGGGRG